ncbi:MAG: flagellar biosynthesis protein FlgH [Proteobacteria bacterium]|nr:MAG: flagellar biosynthesis protein FlgH [Pseudomonadota bacterium]
MTGCASMMKAWKNLIGAQDEDPLNEVRSPRFSESENMKVNNDKQYRRMNRQRFEDEADLKADAGSLWVMEGQGAYLFSQNQMRMVGDLLNVKLEGNPRTQLTTKVKVITKLLDRLDNPNRGPASAKPGAPAAVAAAPAPVEAPAAADAAAPAGDGAQAAGAAAPKDNLSVQTVPTRIVEQLKDGSYRVRGMQPFMIGKREYKVIVTGVVRPEDFDDAGIESSKLLDPQFDIVSSRKGATL